MMATPSRGIAGMPVATASALVLMLAMAAAPGGSRVCAQNVADLKADFDRGKPNSGRAGQTGISIPAPGGAWSFHAASTPPGTSDKESESLAWCAKANDVRTANVFCLPSRGYLDLPAVGRGNNGQIISDDPKTPGKEGAADSQSLAVHPGNPAINRPYLRVTFQPKGGAGAGPFAVEGDVQELGVKCGGIDVWFYIGDQMVSRFLNLHAKFALKGASTTGKDAVHVIIGPGKSNSCDQGSLRLVLTRATTTAAPTTTANPLIATLQKQLKDLKDSVESGDQTNAATIKKELGLVEGVLGELKTEVDTMAKSVSTLAARVDAVEAAGKTAQDKFDASTSNIMQQQEGFAAELQTILSTLDDVVAAPVRPEPTASRCKSRPCAPVVETAGTGALAIAALGGKITFETDECKETDLCQLSRDVQALLAKFAQ